MADDAANTQEIAPGSSNYFVRMQADLTSVELTNCVKNRSRLLIYSMDFVSTRRDFTKKLLFFSNFLLLVRIR